MISKLRAEIRVVTNNIILSSLNRFSNFTIILHNQTVDHVVSHF
jgi:hypothetical protein